MLASVSSRTVRRYEVLPTLRPDGKLSRRHPWPLAPGSRSWSIHLLALPCWRLLPPPHPAHHLPSPRGVREFINHV